MVGPIGTPARSMPFMTGFIAEIQTGTRSLFIKPALVAITTTSLTTPGLVGPFFHDASGLSSPIRRKLVDMATTVKGERTKARIVLAAADLIAKRGVAGTSLDDVREKTRTSKSQVYHYFPDKAALLRDVIATQTDRVLDRQRPTLDRLDSWAAIERWCDELVAGKAKQGCHGSCPIGSLVTEPAETDPIARAGLAKAFDRSGGY